MSTKKEQKLNIEADCLASARKEDHIDMAFKSQTSSQQMDSRFNYEPIFNPSTVENLDLSATIVDKKMAYPIWISSMTGGTEKAKNINENLAKLCGEYGLGMGLGSCRQLLYEDLRIPEFDVRRFMPNAPLMINLGIAQIEELIIKEETARIDILIKKLAADGLIIHINPLQEWMQPEGDQLKYPALKSITELLSIADYPIIVKEVGQGFGPRSLAALLKLPLAALDLAGFGGTNFAKLELLRSSKLAADTYSQVFNQGHCCAEMVEHINTFEDQTPKARACKTIIISGGIKDFLDGYYLMQKCKVPSIYAQASGFLKYALDYNELKAYLEHQIRGLKMAHAYLEVK